MARRLSDGSIQMSDGRIIYGDTFLNAQDFIELLPLFSPAPAWPFVSGGGGSGDSGGFTPTGALAARGLQGFQGTNPGVQGPQGIRGTQGAVGPQGLMGQTGAQGAQGRQGNQGNQGIVGPQGVQGAQGNQGNVGIQGFQGTNPGVQGPQGFQGLQGPQGFQGNIGPQGTTSNGVNLQFGINSSVPGGGTLQLEGPGTALVGATIVRAGTITGASITVNASSTNSYDLEIRVNGVTVATVNLAPTFLKQFTAALAVPVAAGDTITVFMVRTAGAGASTFNDQQALIEITS